MTVAGERDEDGRCNAWWWREERVVGEVCRLWGGMSEDTMCEVVSCGRRKRRKRRGCCLAALESKQWSWVVCGVWPVAVPKQQQQQYRGGCWVLGIEY